MLVGMDQNPTGAVAIDPVCGMDVETADAKYSASVEGIEYFFCGRGCMLEFQDDPEHFLDPEYVAGP
jgi:YHS domain-containing protein